MKRALLTCVGTLLLPALALAQSPPGSPDGERAQARLDPSAVPPGIHLVDDAEPKTPLVPRAADLLGSHLLFGAAVGPTWSLGKLGGDFAAARSLGVGLGLRADAGFGLSRSVVLGVWGSFSSHSDGQRCGDSCSGRGVAVGPFVRYQLSQGLRLDPWFTLGGGYHRLTFDDQAGRRQKFTGVEWLHLELGADYYLFSGFGLGPYGALGLTSYTTRPAFAGGAAVNTELSAGLRFLLDLPGR